MKKMKLGAVGWLMVLAMLMVGARAVFDGEKGEMVIDARPVATEAEREEMGLVAEFEAVVADSKKAVASPDSSVGVSEVVDLGVAVRTDDTGTDAGGRTMIYQHMLYGHSTQSFGAKVKRLAVGSTFTVTVDGVRATYRVVGREVLGKDDLNNNTAKRLSIYRYSQGLSLMTCGNGYNDDASLRLVLYAVRV